MPSRAAATSIVFIVQEFGGGLVGVYATAAGAVVAASVQEIAGNECDVIAAAVDSAAYDLGARQGIDLGTRLLPCELPEPVRSVVARTLEADRPPSTWPPATK